MSVQFELVVIIVVVMMVQTVDMRDVIQTQCAVIVQKLMDSVVKIILMIVHIIFVQMEVLPMARLVIIKGGFYEKKEDNR